MKNLILLSIMILSISCTKTKLQLIDNNSNKSLSSINKTKLCQYWWIYAKQTNNNTKILTSGIPTYIQYFINNKEQWSDQYTTYNYTWKWINDTTLLDIDTTIYNINNCRYIIQLNDSIFNWYNISGSNKYIYYCKKV